MTSPIAAPLIVLLIDSDPQRARIVEQGLQGEAIIKQAAATHGADLLDCISQLQPDVIIVDCDSPDRDTIEGLRTVARENPKPVVMFVEDDDGTLAKEAVHAGVSAYIVDGLTAARVKPVLEVAIERFRMVDALHKQLEKSREDLEARKVIDRAKGLLMDKKSFSESDAYAQIRQLAMKEGKSMKQVSENILSVFSILEV